jgi:hypothetical protein
MSLTITDTSPPDYEATVSGTLVFDLASTQTKTYTFEVQGMPGGITDYEFDIPKEEAEDDTTSNIDPGKVFVWLMKKLKEAVCPECK